MKKKGEINGIQHGRSALPAGGQRKKADCAAVRAGGHRLPVCGGGRGAAVPGAERGTFLEPDERPELCAGIADQGADAAGCGGGPPERGRPLGTPAHPGGAGRGPAALAAPHPERAELSAAVHLGKERRGGKGQRHPPHGGAQSAQRHGVCAGNGRHRWCGVGSVDKLCHAGCLPAQRAAEIGAGERQPRCSGAGGRTRRRPGRRLAGSGGTLHCRRRGGQRRGAFCPGGLPVLWPGYPEE